MKVFFGYGKVTLQDILMNSGGFMVLYKDQCRLSHSASIGHDELLEELASQCRWNKEEVHFGGIRLYYMYNDGNVYVSGVREDDNRQIEQNLRFYGRIILKTIMNH